ncbi:hypothetical protein ACJIZ3_018923 [Penstemon smallii]|uniref:DUF632 domain-containing protein n=1 Tax=Penstemon smallii TaxID=265156 RepID=A0ABD3SZP8_9LAMI
MGCSMSKLDDLESVQLCKDRKNFIRQAVEHRTKFVSGHNAYIQAMKRVSAALQEYINRDEPFEFKLDSFTTPPTKSETKSTYKINCLRSGGNSSILIEERPPQSPQTCRVESHYVMDFSPMSSSIPLPQTSQWDFWDPFSSLDYYVCPTKQEEIDDRVDKEEETVKSNVNLDKEEVIVEDVNIKNESIEVEKAQNEGEISNKETVVADYETNEETPGYTVYMNRGSLSMAEVIKDLQDQFKNASNSAGDMSCIFEASRPRCSASSNDLTVMKMFNPVALLRSASSSHESSLDFLQDPSALSGSHQSTLDRLYIWEKKLYHEVRGGERKRMAFEKKCEHLRNLDAKGENDPSLVAAIRDLHTQIKVSIHSVEAVSKRIETLLNEELEPHLLELVQGLSKMWNAMAECHQFQKRTLDEAKILLARTTSSKHSSTNKNTIVSPSEPHKLVTELKNWQSCFDSWILSQRSYVRALKGWLSCCTHSNSDSSKSPFTPLRSERAPSVFNFCIQWVSFLDDISEVHVLNGLDFFATGIESLYARKLKEDSRTHSGDLVVGDKEVEDEMDDVRVLCAGMSVAVTSLTEFAVSSSEGYANLIKQWDNDKHRADPT